MAIIVSKILKTTTTTTTTTTTDERILYTDSTTNAFRVCLRPYNRKYNVLNASCNKGRGICYPDYGMMHIKEPLLLIKNSSPYGAVGFLSRILSGHLPYV